jgi:hypothetical protein
VASLNSVPIPQHDPPTHKRLFCSLVFGRVGEYFKVNCALAPFSHAPTSFDTTTTFITQPFESNGYFPFFFKDYEPDQNLELSSNSFKLTFQCMPHLLASGHFGMVFEHLRIVFIQNVASGFL